MSSFNFTFSINLFQIPKFIAFMLSIRYLAPQNIEVKELWNSSWMYKYLVAFSRVDLTS